jgi:eukaryotic-like serine/threonine-protein kinase
VTTTLGGRYQLVRELEPTDMWRIFEALDKQTGKSVAAKTPSAGSEYDLNTLLSFQKEGALLRTFKHPNIVRIHGAFLEGGTCYIIADLLDARPLSQILDTEQLSFQRIRHVARQVASALEYAHKRSIIHCNVRPRNILVERRDHVKVVDFGLAGILTDADAVTTTSGSKRELPFYVSPEQIEGLKLDGRTDIYSLGAVLYQMVTGHPPFAGKDRMSVALARFSQEPEPPSAARADIPPDLEALILRALSRKPENRFQSAAEMEAVLAGPPEAQASTARCPSCGNEVRGTARFCTRCGSAL